MKDKTIGRILAFFLLISAVLAVVAVDSVRNINRSVASSDWVNHTHAVILEANGVASAAQAGNAAALTYLITGEARSQAQARDALSDMFEHLEVAKALTRNEPSQHAQVLRLETLVNQRAEFLRSAMADAKSNRPEAERAYVASDAIGASAGEIQRAVEKLTEEEMALLADRDRASYIQAQTTRWTVGSGVALDVLLLGGVAWLIWTDIEVRRRAAAALREANELLETKVRERTAELASANEHLTTENFERRWANQALEHQVRYNELIIDSINDLVFVLTKSLNISRLNPAVVRLTGFEAEELINHPFPLFARITTAGGAPLVDPLSRALIEGHDLRDQRAIVTDKRGREIPVSLALFPLRDRDKVVGGVAILQVLRESS